jgi:SAM-dependent methyltransferase
MELERSLELQERAWNERPLLRSLYTEWYRWIVERLSPVAGQSIELGSGIGKLRLVAGQRVALTDVVETRWVDRQVDALNLPYGDGALANIVMVDVFHHLPDPSRFLDEASRTLTPGGRLVMVEPYCSPLSTLFYRRFHHERTDLSVDPFAADPISASAPMESNQAIPTLAFYRLRHETSRRWPSLALAEEKRFACFLYPLTGGFSRRPLVPQWLYTPLQTGERWMRALSPIMAFRCLVVLERIEARAARLQPTATV